MWCHIATFSLVSTQASWLLTTKFCPIKSLPFRECFKIISWQYLTICFMELETTEKLHKFPRRAQLPSGLSVDTLGATPNRGRFVWPVLKMQDDWWAHVCWFCQIRSNYTLTQVRTWMFLPQPDLRLDKSLQPLVFYIYQENRKSYRYRHCYSSYPGCGHSLCRSTCCWWGWRSSQSHRPL